MRGMCTMTLVGLAHPLLFFTVAALKNSSISATASASSRRARSPKAFVRQVGKRRAIVTAMSSREELVQESDFGDVVAHGAMAATISSTGDAHPHPKLTKRRSVVRRAETTIPIQERMHDTLHVFEDRVVESADSKLHQGLTLERSRNMVWSAATTAIPLLLVPILLAIAAGLILAWRGRPSNVNQLISRPRNVSRQNQRFVDSDGASSDACVEGLASETQARRTGSRRKATRDARNRLGANTFSCVPRLTWMAETADGKRPPCSTGIPSDGESSNTDERPSTGSPNDQKAHPPQTHKKRAPVDTASSENVGSEDFHFGSSSDGPAHETGRA